MPRKNHNAQPVYRPKESWIGLLPYQGRIDCRGVSHLRQDARTSGLKVTGESIVKEFRREENAKHRDSPHSTPLRGAVNRDSPYSTFQPYRVIPQAHPSFIRRFFDRINWQTLSDLGCCGLAIVAIGYIFIIKIFPFIIKEFWK